jgi:hypothetical protein
VSPEQRRYLFVQSAIGAGIVNAVLNGAIGWGATHGLAQFPVWSVPGVAADILATAFGVSFGTCFGALLQVRLDTARGKITPPTELPPFLSLIVSRAPKKLFRRAVALGLVSVPLFAPPVLVALAASGAVAMDRGAFVALKAAFSAVEGVIVTPVIVLAALLDTLDTLDARPAS